MMALFRSIEGEAKEPGDLQDTLNRIANTAKTHFSADLCVVFPMNPITGRFLKVEPTVAGNLSKVVLDDFRNPREDGLAKHVLEEKTIYVEQDRINNFKNPFTDKEQIQAFTALHLFTTTRLQKSLAVIYLDYRNSKRFDEQYKSDLEIFKEFASSELQQTWFIRRYREIAKIGKEINENLENLDIMFEKIFTTIRGILDVSYYFSIAKYNEARNDVDIYYVEKNGKRVITNKNYSLRNSISSWVITNMITRKIDNIDKEDWSNGVEPIHIVDTETEEKSLIFVPIKLTDQPLGVISVQHPEPYHYDDEDLQILELLANHISLALNNSRLLEDLSLLDTSGQLLTQKLDTSENIIQEVVEIIHNVTQADNVILYPYQKSKNEYYPPISAGEFRTTDSIKQISSPNPNAIVHLVNLLDKPIYAEESVSLYTLLGKKYSNVNNFPTKENALSSVAIPLKVGDEPIGSLFINYRKKQKFDKAQQWMINSLSTYAAIAIRNSRHFQELRLRRIKELEDLRQIDRAISKILDRDKILQTILELTTKHIKANTGVILLHNKKLNAIEAKAAIGENLPPLEKQVYALDQLKGIAKTAFEAKMTIRIDNVRTDSEWKDKYSENSPHSISEMDVPLLLDNEAIGVMNFESSREAAFSDDDQNFMETLAGQAVIAIKNAIEYERAKRIAEEREALIDIVNTLLLQTDQKEIFTIILKKALEITETTKGTINICDEVRREIKIVAENGLKEEWKDKVQTFDEGVIGRVAREKLPIRIDKISIDPLREEFLDAFLGTEESELAVPILDGTKIVGVINLESEHPYHFEDDDTELIKSLALLCVVALKTFESLQEKQLASVGLITGDISHKMNSPLSKIKARIELIEINCEDILKNNSYLAEKIKQINNITSDTITMVQNKVNEAKRSFAKIERVSLEHSIKKAVEEIDFPPNITSVYNLNGNKPLFVLATPELSNVFHNLISNAIRAMPEGGKISFDLIAASENWIIISVEDTGIGIPEYMAQMVFQASDRGQEGHGFGLPMTKAYIEMIGGKIDPPISGKDGKGAKFIIHLKNALSV